MFRLSIRLAMLALATIGLLGLQPAAEAAVVPSHISADVLGEVEQTTTPCPIVDWEDPVTHSPGFPNATGLKAVFKDTVITGFFHLETNLLGFVGEVITLPTALIEACLTNIPGTPDDPKLFNYGVILPGGSFSSPVSGPNPLPETALTTPFTCVAGSVSGGLFITAATHATALIDIDFTVTPAAGLGVPCPTHGPPTTTVTVLALLTVIPCGTVPGNPCTGAFPLDIVVGTVELLPL